MKISMLCLSPDGYKTALRIQDILKNKYETEIFRKGTAFEDSVPQTLQVWTKQHFEDEAVIFISSAGIAVRAIAPFIQSKKTDPAVLAVDDRFRFVIPLLSGHLGGANSLAAEIAEAGGATAVITTSTDIHGKLAPDVFAQKNGLKIMDFTAAKLVAAALVRGETIPIYTDTKVEGKIPPEVQIAGLHAFTEHIGGAAIVISPVKPHTENRPDVLWLVPQTVYLGIGLKEGKSRESVERAVMHCLTEAGVCPEALAGAASIDIKAKEAGLLAFADAYSLPIRFFGAEALNHVSGNFTESAFVRSVTGTGNVCERSAVLLACAGAEPQEETDSITVLQPKTALDGVTAALAVRKGRIRFE